MICSLDSQMYCKSCCISTELGQVTGCNNLDRWRLKLWADVHWSLEIVPFEVLFWTGIFVYSRISDKAVLYRKFPYWVQLTVSKNWLDSQIWSKLLLTFYPQSKTEDWEKRFTGLSSSNRRQVQTTSAKCLPFIRQNITGFNSWHFVFRK